MPSPIAGPRFEGDDEDAAFRGVPEVELPVSAAEAGAVPVTVTVTAATVDEEKFAISDNNKSIPCLNAEPVEPSSKVAIVQQFLLGLLQQTLGDGAPGLLHGQIGVKVE
jgi:hypothetical protein